MMPRIFWDCVEAKIRLKYLGCTYHRIWCQPNMILITFENALYWYLLGLKLRWSTDDHLPARENAAQCLEVNCDASIKFYNMI